MRKGYKLTLGVLTIMILLTITVGTSYSYYSVSASQTETNSLTASCFDIEFQDGNNSITLNTTGSFAYPMSEENAKSKLTPYTFTITNKCSGENDSAIKYQVVINTKGELNSKLKYILTTNGTLTEESGSSLSAAPKFEYPPLVTATEKMDGTENSYNLKTGSLAHGVTETYHLLLWIPDDACEGDDCQTSIMGKDFEGQILIYTSM